MGLRSKSEELVLLFEMENINPHILCLSEHHIEEHELLHLTLSGFTLCRGRPQTRTPGLGTRLGVSC